MSRQINIDEALGDRATITVEPVETPEERAARIKTERGQATFELVKAYVVLAVTITAIVAIGTLCTYFGFFDSAASAETKKWAQTTLAALFTGCVGFVLGQKTVKAG